MRANTNVRFALTALAWDGRFHLPIDVVVEQARVARRGRGVPSRASMQVHGPTRAALPSVRARISPGRGASWSAIGPRVA
jgi:hypothetical protein